MTRFIIGVVLMVGVVCQYAVGADPADTHPDLHLIPWPKKLERDTGRMSITADSQVVAGAEQLRPLAEVLAREIDLATGLKLKVTTGPGQAGDIVLQLDKSLKADEPMLTLREGEPVRTTDGAHTINIDRSEERRVGKERRS